MGSRILICSKKLNRKVCICYLEKLVNSLDNSNIYFFTLEIIA